MEDMFTEEEYWNLNDALLDSLNKNKILFEKLKEIEDQIELKENEEKYFSFLYHMGKENLDFQNSNTFGGNKVKRSLPPPKLGRKLPLEQQQQQVRITQTNEELIDE